jgi:hypothetical protein
MQVGDQKIDCQLLWKGHAIDVLLHLIEVRYSKRIVFWNGVAQLTMDDVAKLGEMQPDDPPVEVRLPDGRTGFLYITHGRMEGGYFELAGTGKPNDSP